MGEGKDLATSGSVDGFLVASGSVDAFLVAAARTHEPVVCSTRVDILVDVASTRLLWLCATTVAYGGYTVLAVCGERWGYPHVAHA